MIKYKTTSLVHYEDRLKKEKSIIDQRHLQDKIDNEIKEIQKLEELIAKPVKNEEELRRVEIILLKYKSPDIEVDCIANIIQYTEHPYKLVVYDNRPNTGNTAKVWNKLVKESTCPYVIIMDTDAFVEEGWLEKMMSVFEKYQDAGVVVPLAGEDSNVTTFQSRHSKDDTIVGPLDGHFSGYCFLFKKETFKHLKGFNEKFYIFGQESDWIERLHEDGKYKIYCHQGVLVQHGYGKEQGGSLSTTKAAEEGEFNWRVDTERAQYLFELLKKQRIKKYGSKNKRSRNFT